MSYVEPPAVWARNKGDENYYSPKEPKVDSSGVKALNAARPFMDAEDYEKAMAKLRASAETGEAVEPTLDNLSAITARYLHLDPLSNETMSSRQSTAVACLDKPWPKNTEKDVNRQGKPLYKDDLDKHVTLVKDAAKTTWKTLRGWCDEMAEGKRTGNLYVKDKDVLERLDLLVRETSEANERKRLEAAARKKQRAAAS